MGYRGEEISGSEWDQAEKDYMDKVDPTAPWNQEEENSSVCTICGGDLLERPAQEGKECFDCGNKDPEVLPLCSMCGDHLPKVVKHGERFRAECECGLCAPFNDNGEAALTDWTILNS